MEDIVIIGSGPVAALTALLLRRTLLSCRISIIGTPLADNAFADQAPTSTPFSTSMFARAGVSEEELLQKAGASHRLVQRYIGWSLAKSGDAPHRGSFTHGAEVDPLRSFGSLELPPVTLAEALASAGRYQPTSNSAAANIPHIANALRPAMRWNVGALQQILSSNAVSAGIEHLAGQISDVRSDQDGRVEEVVLRGGQCIKADLYIDCSGPGRHLASLLPGFEARSWGEYLPIRSLVLGPPLQPHVALEDRFSLLQNGWLSEFAGRDGLQRTYAISQAPDAADLERVFGSSLNTHVVYMEPSALSEPWVGNVVTLGDAAASFEPLGHLSCDLAHRQLDLLLELLPGKTLVPQERREFNRRAKLMADNIRDTLGVVYASEYGQRVFGTLKRSDALQRLLDQFGRRNRIAFAEEAALTIGEVRSLCYAVGIQPGQGLLDQLGDPAEQKAALDSHNQMLQQVVAAAPPYQAWLEKHFGQAGNISALGRGKGTL